MIPTLAQTPHISRVYAAGKVRRWHANPALAHIPQTNADHVGGCVRLLLMLHPAPSLALIRAMAHHDDGERWCGDLPADFKAAVPDVAVAHAEAEAEALRTMLGFDVYAGLTHADRDWLKLIDRLEAYIHVAMYRPEELRRNGWPQSRAALLDMAAGLDLREPDRVISLQRAVHGLLDDMAAGAF